jgi:hypothetical protein
MARASPRNTEVRRRQALVTGDSHDRDPSVVGANNHRYHGWKNPIPTGSGKVSTTGEQQKSAIADRDIYCKTERIV